MNVTPKQRGGESVEYNNVRACPLTVSPFADTEMSKSWRESQEYSEARSSDEADDTSGLESGGAVLAGGRGWRR